MELSNISYERFIKKELFEYAMRGSWKDVIEIYKKDTMLQEVKITRTGDTALHIAVSYGLEDVVKQMVGIMSTSALKIQNNGDKNTVLHIAASMGNLKMCVIIAEKDPLLVDVRNINGETPLFLAVLHGRNQVFLWLHFIRNPPTNSSSSSSSPYYGNCRRNDGDTILHCAIHGDHFDLAFQIINLYEMLVHWVNEEGWSPLHLLALKPSTFKSSSRLGLIETVFYHSIFVEKLQKADPRKYVPAYEEQPPPKSPSIKNIKGHAHECPKNYKTCWDVFKVVKIAIGKVLHFSRNKSAEDLESVAARGSRIGEAQAPLLFPANYRTFSEAVMFLYRLLLTIFIGLGSHEMEKIRREKEKHTWCVQILNAIVVLSSYFNYDDSGMAPQRLDFEDDFTTPFMIFKPSTIRQNDCEGGKLPKKLTKETPILIAAKNGVIEIIKEIVDSFPVAIHDMNDEEKNIVLLAVQHRQPHVYQFMLKRNIFKESLFGQVDDEGNSALHLVAKFGDYKPWLVADEVLQMQWEIKWYTFVKESMPRNFFALYNKKGETPVEVLTKTHKELMKSVGDWLNKTSESCSVVAALIATVAFATAATVPGGVEQNSGRPVLEGEALFSVFTISSFMALWCSLTALVMFLSIVTSRYQEFDFGMYLPKKLLLGLTSLFMSIAAMLVSFCASHFFVLKPQLYHVALPIYIIICLPLAFSSLGQFPLYLYLLRATFNHVPQRAIIPEY